jgi:hypothetical protein
VKVTDLIDVLEDFPPTAEVTVAVEPGRCLAITGTRITMERDAGELCQPAEVTLLPMDVFDPDDLEGAL